MAIYHLTTKPVSRKGGRSATAAAAYLAVDFALHEPHREGDRRNFHAHVLTTTRSIEAGGLGPQG